MPGRLQQSANRAAALRKRQMDRLAQLVSEGVGVNQAGERMKLTKGQTARLWATIKREMGGQAR
jgi:hypothetical protein